jgi:aspartyl-tRNA(Asn)/glutamyl-tRNA(Gln) amidotransferase subunit A
MSHRHTRDALGAATERFHRHDQRLRAVITWLPGAEERAGRLDREATPRGPLHGRLVTLKDNIDLAGAPTTAGASFWRDRVPAADADVVQRLDRAGLLPVAKTNLSELALGATTANRTFGVARNPWDESRIPGGSSGGSGASVAAGYAELSLGTDTGGSVRIPAALNGVLGLRPSLGRISIRGVVPLSWSQDTVGPMGRHARDVALLTDVITSGSGFRPAAELLGRPIGGLRAGIVDTGEVAVDPEVARLVGEFRAWLELAGVTTGPVAVPQWEQAAGVWTAIAPVEGAAVFEERLRERPADFAPDVLARLAAGLRVTGPEHARALEWRSEHRLRLAAMLQDSDVLVSPTTPTVAPPIEGDDALRTTARLGALVHPWALHDGPTLSLPIGFTAAGLPVGASLTAAFGAEAVLFQLAEAYQRATDHHRRDPFPVPGPETAG